MDEITLAEIISAVPGVGAVLGSIAKNNGRGYWQEYSRYKRILGTMIGWYAPYYEDKRLRGELAFRIVIRAVEDALDGVLVLPKPEEAGA